MNKKTKILLITLAVLIVIQFIPLGDANESFDPKDSFMNVLSPPDDVADLFRKSCYDCHSYESQYPWYSKIAPVSFYTSNHIREGRGKLNFSVWNTYSEKRKAHKLDGMYEMINEGDMPLKSYLLMHSAARLSDKERKQITSWILTVNGGRIPEEHHHDDD